MTTKKAVVLLAIAESAALARSAAVEWIPFGSETNRVPVAEASRVVAQFDSVVCGLFPRATAFDARRFARVSLAGEVDARKPQGLSIILR